ncbi:MAG: hemerythrin domain-containing protein [Acidimicrobiales bacterium]
MNGRSNAEEQCLQGGLEADHRQVKLILTELAVASGDLGSLAQRLVVEKPKHEATEEMHFRPAVREKLPNGDALADAALEQEEEGKEALDALRKAKPGDAEFLRLVDRLGSAGQAHISYEETQVWPVLRTVLSSKEVDELGSKLESAKESGPTRPHPGGRDDPAGLKSLGVAASAMDRVRDAITNRD